MPTLFVDRAIEIDALPSKVWNVLTKAGYTSQWAPEFYGGASFRIESSWRKGASVLWKDEQGQTIVEGEVTRLEPDKILRFTVFDARAPERPATTEEDGITFELAQRGDHTLLKLRQGDFSAMPDGEKYRQMSEDVWDRVLPRIKRLAEEPTAEAEEIIMQNNPTCGKGLAENSILPGKLGELAAAMAENFEVHMRALDVNDPFSRQEYEVYVQLANEQRETAARLLATANEMAGARDLPMGPHSFNHGLNAQALAAFENVVKVKAELLALLRQSTERDQALLTQMRSSNKK